MAEEIKNLDLVNEDRKESFDIGVSNEELLRRIKTWENEAETVYNVLKPVWAKNEEYYRGIQTDVQSIYGKFSRAVENRIWMAVETLIPIATARLPDIVVKPGDDDEASVNEAQDLQDVLGYQFERMSVQSHAERFIRNMILKRYGVFKVPWDADQDDVSMEEIDPRRVRIPKFGKSVHALAFIIEDLELSYGTCVDFFGEETAKKLLENLPKDSKEKVRKPTFSIKEVWTNDLRVYATQSLILKKENNPYYDFKNKNKNFCAYPTKPYVIKSLFETDESLIGDTDYVTQTIPIQDNINIRKRQIEDITNKVADPKLAIDSDVMSEEEAGNITNEPGGILYGKDAANESKIRFHSPGAVPQYLFQDLEFSRTEFDNIWGIHASTRGEREGRETLGGRQLLREADLGRIDLIGRQLERALDEIAELWTQQIKMFYTDERAFSIIGKDGARFVKNFSGKKVSPSVKPMVTPGSTLKEDDAAIKQNAIILWQNKAIGIKTLYHMLKMPNPMDAMEDWRTTQSGEALKGGQGGTVTMPPNTSPVGEAVPEAANMGGQV